MNMIVTAVVSLLGQLLPLVGSNSTLITQIIETLVAILPTIVKEVQDLIPPIKNIIAALSADPATSAAQLATLQVLDQQCDAAFEEAAIDLEADAAEAAKPAT